MDDNQVQLTLSSLGKEPQLEGETPEDRVFRLRNLLNASEKPEKLSSHLPLLLQCRHRIAADSFSKAKSRLEREKANISNTIPSFSPIGSMYCDSRLPMSISIDNNNESFAIGGWSNDCTIWSIQGKLLRTMQGHTDKVQCVSMYNNQLASGSFDNTIRLWGNTVEVLCGHNARVNSVEWHKNLNYLLSASHDMTWKIWDCEEKKCVLTQEGHNRGVYCLSLHPDGSLVATGDLAGIGALWDLRTGKLILTLKGHLKQVLSCCIADNGYLIATGSDDNTVKLWDIRRKGLLYSIPAHSKLVSSLDINNGTLASGSYDGLLKLWRLSDFALVQSINHEEKITDLAFTSNGGLMISACFDRTFKVWNSGNPS